MGILISKMIDRSTLFKLLTEGAVVLTANNRLAAHLQRDYFAHSHGQILDKPACLPYQQFLQQTFHNYCKSQIIRPQPVLLSTAQMHYLWQQILGQHPDYFMNKGLVHAVEDAWKRCLQWRIDIHDPLFQSTPQTRLFQNWVLQFEQRLQQLFAICDNQLVEYLINNDVTMNANHFIWLCFDDFTPQQLALQDLMKAQGLLVSTTDLPEQQTKVQLYEAADEQDEFQQLSLWLQTQLTKNRQRIAVVVPNLQTEGKKLQRLLKKQLPAASFDISLGEKLSSFGLINHALCWLSLTGKTLDSHQARLLLHSPYLLGAKSELSGRAKIMQDNLCVDETFFEIKRLLPALHQFSPQLAEALINLPPYPANASPSEWAVLFSQRLQFLGFPGEYTLNSVNYQCYQRLSGILDEFRQLQLITPEIDFQTALSALRELTDNTIFQPQKIAAQIQILGMLEASGCTYDSLWITGMSDECLPQKARLSAFIPITLQQSRQMPHASPARELMLANKQIHRFCVSAPDCVFSYPKFTQDKPNLVSPLLNKPAPYLPIEPLITAEEPVLEAFEETYQLPPQSSEPIKGGSALLANQAKCPFRAFAAHRLHASAKPIMMEGLNHLERGQIIHKIMEMIWQSLKNQHTLLTIDESQLQLLITNAIDKALMPYQKENKETFSPLIQKIEHQRLRTLVEASLEWERSRPDFSVVALEKTYTLQLSGINFTLRVDRLDEVAEGYQWVIDYKSGIPQNLPWKEERPREPQLLLYALLEEKINTLVFATLKNGQINTKGLSEENYEGLDITPLKKGENWTSQRHEWQKRLQLLADEFSQGHCIPQPISSSVCQQCDFQSLCRFSAESLS